MQLAELTVQDSLQCGPNRRRADARAGPRIVDVVLIWNRVVIGDEK